MLQLQYTRSFAREIYFEFVKKDAVNESQSDTSLLLKRIDELEKKNELYQHNGKIKEDEYLKQNKILEKQIEKLEFNLQKKDNDIIKLNKNLICLTKDVKEKDILSTELKNIIEQNNLQITKLQNLIKEKDLQINDLENRYSNEPKQISIEKNTDENLCNDIGLWVTKESTVLNKANLKKIFITNLDTEKTVLDKLRNISELWYIEYEISIFMVRKLQKILKNNNYAMKLNKFLSIQEIDVMLSKRS